MRKYLRQPLCQDASVYNMNVLINTTCEENLPLVRKQRKHVTGTFIPGNRAEVDVVMFYLQRSHII